ncbi:MAG: EAL domain-containing protein [Leptolyngbyaceae cyanobacterium SM1_1_3]|nr:EAL domain-containing protein [Leptolyngbyaceae cyanobacterium SM1_1_3]NJN03238.1 EAL domain-containing protein [Leptolyngbyaceae cyanobacterium RM1_1_2]NJO10935.1 EAL domain-containing protein [Leptolyngbyaceae cyanobacterium SL_1_1]
MQFTHHLLDALLKPYSVEQETLHLTTCIGLALPSKGDRGEQILANACMALQRTKQQGKNCFEFHSAEMTLRLQEHLHLEHELRQALERDQLQLYYQPQIDLRSGRIVGAECLLRWHYPKLGTVSPSQVTISVRLCRRVS